MLLYFVIVHKDGRHGVIIARLIITRIACPLSDLHIAINCNEKHVIVYCHFLMKSYHCVAFNCFLKLYFFPFSPRHKYLSLWIICERSSRHISKKFIPTEMASTGSEKNASERQLAAASEVRRGHQHVLHLECQASGSANSSHGK